MTSEDLSRMSLKQIHLLKADVQSGLLYDLLHAELVRRRKAAYESKLTPEELADHKDYLQYLEEVRGYGVTWSKSSSINCRR